MLATPHPVHFEKLSSIGPRSVAGLETTRERAVPRSLFAPPFCTPHHLTVQSLFLKVLPCVMLWCSAIILAPRSGLDCRTTSTARWHGRRPSAVAAVVFHRRDRRSGGASNRLVCYPLVHFCNSKIADIFSATVPTHPNPITARQPMARPFVWYRG